MKGLYSRKCASRSESQEDVDSESVLSGIQEGKARVESDFGGERGQVGTEHDRCEFVCREELHMIPCECERYLEIGH